MANNGLRFAKARRIGLPQEVGEAAHHSVYPNEDDEVMYQWLKSQPNTTEYLKKLVAADMEKHA